MSAATARGPLVGQPLERREDERLLTGRGRYVDDLGAGAAEVAFVRSEHAHALIADVDVSRALAVDGVHAIYTWEDLDGRVAEPLPMIPHPEIVAPRTQHALAREEVCYAGEIVAMVVARDRYVAEDAAAAVRVAYAPLEPIVDLAAAAGAVAVAHRDMGDNLAGAVRHEAGDVDAALAAAPHVWAWRLEIERSAAMPMECRAVLARWDAGDGSLHVWDTTQAPHNIRFGLADVLGLERERVHVTAPDVGGGFGVKLMQFYPEEVLVPWAARRLGRAVKWTEDRREHFSGSNHERGQLHDVVVGADDDGRLLALDLRFDHDCGAYAHYGLVIPVITAVHVPGPYRLPNYRCSFRALYTNTTPTSVYRGAGRPQSSFVMERTLDRVAAELGIDRAEIRRRNLLTPGELPHAVGFPLQDGTPAVYDSGDYPAMLERLLDAVGYDAFAAEQAAAAAEGRMLGLGLAANVEGTGVGPYETASVRVGPDGGVHVAVGSATQGQSHETAFAQVAADELSVPFERVRVSTGDTRHAPSGIGTFASRSAVMAGSAVQRAAAAVHRQAQEQAALLLGVEPAQVVLRDGVARAGEAPEAGGIALGALAAAARPLRFAWHDEDRSVQDALAAARVARDGRWLADGAAPGLEAVAHFSPTGHAFSAGMQAIVVEIDRDTCDLLIRRHVVVHDCGRLINPLVVEGQVHGGLAQGVGGAFYERLAYDARGQLQNASFMDFLIPFATEVPRAEVHHVETPSPLNPLGVKGAGEAGTIPVSAAVANALADALGCDVDRMPLSPLALYEAIVEQRAVTARPRHPTDPGSEDPIA